MKRRNHSKKNISKLFIIVLSFTLIFMTACSSTSQDKISDVKLSTQEETKLTTLLGALNDDVPEQVRKEVGQLLHKVEDLREQREEKGDYEKTDEEYELWEKITQALDKETIRQFGEDDYDEEDEDSNEDHGKGTINNLKKTLSKKDWKNLNELRDDFFEATESNDEDYDVDIEEEIRKIVNKYEQLDSDAIVLNLLDDKSQENLAMFCITPDYDIVYQDGSKNGLKSLSADEQNNMKKYWDIVTEVLPKKLFSNFKYFKVGGDGELGTYAFVIQVDDEGKTWCLNIDPADIKDDGVFPYTIVHEMSHYLSLNDKQVEYFKDEVELSPQNTYNDGQCVAREDSYIQGFYENFWKDLKDDWETNTENTYFFWRHESEFVTAYAATECAEDFAESFCAYVLMESAPTEAIQAKFDYFDSYPELKEIKKEILEKVKENAVFVNKEIEPEDGELFEEAA